MTVGELRKILRNFSNDAVVEAAPLRKGKNKYNLDESRDIVTSSKLDGYHKIDGEEYKENSLILIFDEE